MSPWGNLDLALVALATSAATLVGGLLALTLKRWTALLVGVSAGAVIGVAVLELAPEALASIGPGPSLIGIALGFLGYLTIDRGIGAIGGMASRHRVHLGPGSLTLHSFLDGLAIGLAFHASAAVGLSVAVAVIAHDLSDGANSVNLSLRAGSVVDVARVWLAADAAAPVLGILLTQLAVAPQNWFPPVLAVLAGGLLYVGVGNLALGHARRIDLLAVAGPALGFGFIYAVARISAA